ncbi:MAG: substrate-binding domain-containing protein [Burkholderiaceae bacterium]
MLQIDLTARWRIGQQDSDAPLEADRLLALLAAVQSGGSIAQAGRELGLSYRHAWGLIRQAEQLFGQQLMRSGRGQGSTLTELGQRLVWADARVGARLQPLLASLASELAAELDRTQRKSRTALRLHASHGFAVAALCEHLAARRMPVTLSYRNSLEAVAALAQGDCDLAGFHVPLGRFESAAAQRYLQRLRPGEHHLVHLAVRTQGLFVAHGNPLDIRGLADLSRTGLRFVNRPEGSGTRFLTDLLLQHQGIDRRRISGYDHTEFTHAAVAAFVASGMADVGIGVHTAADRFGLHFIPLLRERYFFAVTDDTLQRADFAPLWASLRSPAFRSKVAALKGYDAGRTGEIVRLDDAFDGLR